MVMSGTKMTKEEFVTTVQEEIKRNGAVIVQAKQSKLKSKSAIGLRKKFVRAQSKN